MTEQWATRDDLNQAREDMQRIGDQIITQINTRFDDAREIGNGRHSENVARLERIETQVRTTNGRVTTLEANVIELFRRVKDRVTGITLADVGRWMAIIGGTYWAMSALGFHK